MEDLQKDVPLSVARSGVIGVLCLSRPGRDCGHVDRDRITTFGVAAGSWVAVFPGTPDRLFGMSYDFHGT
jgi:hypothetical protein